LRDAAAMFQTATGRCHCTDEREVCVAKWISFELIDDMHPGRCMGVALRHL
jgi:hypothetical protein